MLLQFHSRHPFRHLAWVVPFTKIAAHPTVSGHHHPARAASNRRASLYRLPLVASTFPPFLFPFRRWPVNLACYSNVGMITTAKLSDLTAALNLPHCTCANISLLSWLIRADLRVCGPVPGAHCIPHPFCAANSSRRSNEARSVRHRSQYHAIGGFDIRYRVLRLRRLSRASPICHKKNFLVVSIGSDANESDALRATTSRVSSCSCLVPRLCQPGTTRTARTLFTDAVSSAPGLRCCPRTLCCAFPSASTARTADNARRRQKRAKGRSDT